MNKTYRVSLCIKREEDRYLARDGSRLKWVTEELSGIILEIPKEEALLYIEAILKAKMPVEPHEIDSWVLLKMQACTDEILQTDMGWKFGEELNPVYIGLCWADEEYHETQWILELNESQVRSY
ncbi:MAG: hypothetical protein P4L77_11820 [Sulfuriferula sp.]|nr:hypothetical protein [Sulfuriferula sp.]